MTKLLVSAENRKRWLPLITAVTAGKPMESSVFPELNFNGLDILEISDVSASDKEGHYDIDGVTFALLFGVIVASDTERGSRWVQRQ